MPALALTAATLVTCLGRGLAAQAEALRARRSGLTPCALPFAELDTMIGRVAGLEDEPLAEPFAGYDCRNNRLARAGLTADGFADQVAAAAARFGPERIAVIIGSSTAGIDRTEAAYRARRTPDGPLPDWFDYRRTHNAFSPADFVRSYLGLAGIGLVVATACASSAKAFAAADRYLSAGLCDAAVVGGVDSLCLTTLYGFNALELIAREPCRPWDAERTGISLGEAAGFALVERTPAAGSRWTLLGWGESSDAYHMSSPRPDGAGAARAMRQALAQSGLTPAAIDYVNLHGTGTPSNDAAEDQAVLTVLGKEVPCSSTKGWTGHTLGAAGIVELLLAALALEEQLVPGTLHSQRIDPALGVNLRLANEPAELRHVLSNSFGFGGGNCSLVLARAAA